MIIEEKLIETIIENDAFLNFVKRKLKRDYKKFSVDTVKRYRKEYKDQAKFYNFKFEGEECVYCYKIQPSNDLGVPMIAVSILVDTKISEEELKDLVSRIRKEHSKKMPIHFYIPTGSPLKKYLIKLGGKGIGLSMHSLVKDTYDYLKQFDYPKEIKLRALTPNDFEEAVELEVLAHGQSKTTRCQGLTAVEYRRFYDFCYKEKKPCIGAFEEGKLIGVISYGFNKTGISFIMSIAVHPIAQKRGISSLLYFHAMKEFKKHGVKIYSGVSTTTEVLKSGKKFGREVCAEYIEIKP